MKGTEVTENAGEKAKKFSDVIIGMIIGHERVVAISALAGALGMAIAHDALTVDELVKRRNAVVAMLDDVIESAWKAKPKGGLTI